MLAFGDTIKLGSLWLEFASAAMVFERLQSSGWAGRAGGPRGEAERAQTLVPPALRPVLTAAA
jgi:hypothetical protein